jgi:hypothetical protein
MQSNVIEAWIAQEIDDDTQEPQCYDVSSPARFARDQNSRDDFHCADGEHECVGIAHNPGYPRREVIAKREIRVSGVPA